MSGGTGEIQLRFQEGRCRRLPLTACCASSFFGWSLAIEESYQPAARLLGSNRRLASYPTTNLARRFSTTLYPGQRSKPLVYRRLAIKSMWAESIPNLSRNLVAVFKEVVDDLSSRSDTPLSFTILPHLFAMWESPYPIPCALGELAVDQDRNATDALRQQLTFETNGRPILGIELLIHFLHNV
jgi:hypothetical protein